MMFSLGSWIAGNVNPCSICMAHYRCRRRKTLVDSESAKLLMPKNCIIRNGDIFGNNSWGNGGTREHLPPLLTSVWVELAANFITWKKMVDLNLLIKHHFFTCKRTIQFLVGVQLPSHFSITAICMNYAKTWPMIICCMFQANQPLRSIYQKIRI